MPRRVIAVVLTFSCANADIGPWNDGSVPGYPIPDYEKFITKYGLKK